MTAVSPVSEPATVPPRQVLTVAELTRRIKASLEQQFPSVWVEGELADVRQHSSGHIYFTLKDAVAQLRAVLFASDARGLAVELKDGLAVYAFGRIGVYEKVGQYQLIARQIVPKGQGALQLAFEQLKRKLQAEGLFDAARKKPLPLLPQRIGVVTSPTGAAIRDFLNIIQRRYPNVHILIYPVRVQGAGAAQEIAAAIDDLNAHQLVDVIVVTRGGGSLEDLWAFNEEIVARALARSRIPTISAVGHEIDFTISDFVADVRAPTPSAAAELVARAKNEFEQHLDAYRQRLHQAARTQWLHWKNRLNELAAEATLRQPSERIRQYQQQLDDLDHRAAQAARQGLRQWRERLQTLAGTFQALSPKRRVDTWRLQLDTARRRLHTVGQHRLDLTAQHLKEVRTRLELLSPLAVLNRGYSITRLSDGRIVRSARQVRTGDSIHTRVADGEFVSVVGAHPVAPSPPKGRPHSK
ncbi:MAG: exodeoxyribonuclease VII large subunit [Verrucomicrobiae bacterium]|nr:exodeoxyribonuclease VII large subunit [Verrucomicrobiae bacterium]